jgi:hypothetical protein
MQLDEVPQDKKTFEDGDKAPRKLIYVTAKDGSYTHTMSDSWEAEIIALELAWETIEHELKQAKT